MYDVEKITIYVIVYTETGARRSIGAGFAGGMLAYEDEEEALFTAQELERAKGVSLKVESICSTRALLESSGFGIVESQPPKV